MAMLKNGGPDSLCMGGERWLSRVCDQVKWHRVAVDMQKGKSLQHPVFPGGHPSKY